MAIARITAQDATASGTSPLSATYPSTPTQGNLLIAIVGDSDGLNNATALSGWTQVVPIGNASSASEVNIFFKIAGASEPTSVSPTFGASITATIAIYEYSGPASSSVLDKSTSAGGAGSPQSTGTTAATTVASDLVIVAGFSSGNTPTFTSWTNSVTLRNSVIIGTFGLFTGDKIVSATGTYESTLTLGGSVAFISTIIATFKSPSSVSARIYNPRQAARRASSW